MKSFTQDEIASIVKTEVFKLLTLDMDYITDKTEIPLSLHNKFNLFFSLERIFDARFSFRDAFNTRNVEQLIDLVILQVLNWDIAHDKARKKAKENEKI